MGMGKLICKNTLFDKYEMKNAIDKLLFQKGSYNHDTVKTNFSKLVLDGSK